MTQSISSQRFRDAAQRITGWRRPLLVSHTKPDCDALGSMLALRLMLRSQGADPLMLLFEAWPERYESLLHLQTSSAGAGASVAVWGRNFAESDFDQVDGVMVLDTCAYGQLRPIADWLRVTDKPKLVVDHHQSADLVADAYLVDVSAAANCVILYEWAKSVGWSIEPDIAAALFVGLATDTGWFRHANTDARALNVAAELATLGVVPHVWYERLYQREKPARLALRAVALESMELLAEDRLSIMTLGASAFAKTGATSADTEDIINEPLQISTVIVSVLLVEQGDGVVRVSLRSKPPVEDRAADIDVAAIAESFNGGGHRRAAGARIEGNPSAVRDRLVETLLAAVSD